MKRPSVVDASSVEKKSGSGYPLQYRAEVESRHRARLGDLFGIDQFGVNVVTLEPGSWSSHRHWHETEDEFVYVLSGELVLVDDAGEHVMKPGMCAGFKASSGNGHQLKNLSGAPATYLEVGTRAENDHVEYSDIDMQAVKIDGKWVFQKKDGSAF